jgi:hypothetical protein
VKITRSELVDQLYRGMNARDRDAVKMGSGLYLEQQVAHLHQFEDGLLRRWWMFGDPEKARRRFLEGDRPGI